MNDPQPRVDAPPAEEAQEQEAVVPPAADAGRPEGEARPESSHAQDASVQPRAEAADNGEQDDDRDDDDDDDEDADERRARREAARRPADRLSSTTGM